MSAVARCATCWRSGASTASIGPCARAWHGGVVVAGLSAGAMSWFQGGVTMSGGMPQPARVLQVRPDGAGGVHERVLPVSSPAGAAGIDRTGARA